MVERCADAGRSRRWQGQVVPTAHYMMGGVEFATDLHDERGKRCSSRVRTRAVSMARNRLGGNGVANSTVFGGIAARRWRRRCARARRCAIRTATRSQRAWPGRKRRCARRRASAAAGDLETIRERLFTTMWDDAGIVRDAPGLARAAAGLTDSATRSIATGCPAAARSRVQRHVARLDQPGEPRRRVEGHRPRRAGAREFPRCAFSCGFPGRGRPRHVVVHARASRRGRRAVGRRGARRLHARTARQLARLTRAC